MKESKNKAGRLRKAARGVTAAAVLGTLGLGAAPVQATQAAPAECVGDSSGAAWVFVEVTGVRNSDGFVTLTIYDDDRSKFLASGGSRDVIRVPAQAGATRACLKLPGQGVYAIAVYHDENRSRRIDRNSLGLPTEGFGFSNNPSTFAGLPAFRSVRLNVAEPGLATRITLRYP
jgi:uncharacterized protein (DUF2141 family)